MQLLKLGALAAAFAALTTVSALGRVRDVNPQRNQVTVVTSKAGEFALGTTVYFFRQGKPSGKAQVSMAFHTKAVARLTEGNPRVDDDASTTNKAPKAAPKISRVSFGATGVQAQELLVEVQFDKQEKQQRKLTLNAEIAAQIEGATGYIGLNAALLKEIEVLWENGALSVKKVRLSDRSGFSLSGFVAADLYAKIKPSSETRAETVKGKITVLKKARDLMALADGIQVDLKVNARSERVKTRGVYKLKIYCNELFASEFILRPQGADLSDTMTLSPVDLTPGENSLEFRLVEVTEDGELMLETDNNQLIGTLLVEKTANDRNPRVAVTLAAGQNTTTNQIKTP